MFHKLKNKVTSVFYSICKKVVISRFKRLKHFRLVVWESYKPEVPSFLAGVFGDPDTEISTAINVNNPRAYASFLFGGEIGGAEAYARGDWTAVMPVGSQDGDLELLFRGMAKNLSKLNTPLSWVFNLKRLFIHIVLRKNNIKNAKHNVHAHYDLGNDFYSRWLCGNMQYSSGLLDTVPDKATLEGLAFAKFNKIGELLDLSEGQSVLEIGCGWGHLAIYLATTYKVNVTAITISEEQYAYCLERLDAANEAVDFDLHSLVEFKLMDYRELPDEYAYSFDGVVSIEMIEQVGREYLETYVDIIERVLVKNGKVVVQAITIPDSKYEKYCRETDFIRHFIFPGGHLFSNEIITEHFEDENMNLVRWVELDQSYALTCKLWLRNFRRTIMNDDSYDQEFLKIWEYYLAYCHAGFKEGVIGCQMTLFEKS